MMQTKECPSCAMEVDAKLSTCPICAYEFPAQPKWITYTAIFLIVVFLLLYLL